LRRVAGDPPSVAFDVTGDGELASGVAEAGELLGGRIDVRVNSAGILTEAPVAEMTVETWEQTLAVDLTGSS
jgi:3-oxoacyl-[acyl-carrier protein] reductase